MSNIYEKCPILETENFIFRLVEIGDAEDLLACYSDPKAQELFNIDNFPSDCCLYTVEEMMKQIEFWLMEYASQAYIRFAVIDKLTNKAIGTIEMFGMVGAYKTEIGLLRIDLASPYENVVILREIIIMCIKNFYDIFEVATIATKAMPKAIERIKVLIEVGFCEEDFKGRRNYFLRKKKGVLV